MLKIPFIFLIALLVCPVFGFPSSGPVPSKLQVPKTKKTVVQEKKIDPKIAAQAQEDLKAEAEKAKKAAERKKVKDIVKKKKASLNKTVWDLEVIPYSQGEKKNDLLTFDNGKVNIQSMLEEGYTASNYTLTIKNNGTLIWETMQSKEGGKVAFLRGEIASDIKSMKGIISYPKGNKTEDYGFTSFNKRILTK